MLLLAYCLTTLFARLNAQIVMNGDPSMGSKHKRATILEDAAKRRVVIDRERYKDLADTECAKYEKKQEDLAYKERGSYTFPDGTPIPGNEDVGVEKIDPRTPDGFGNPFKREADKQKAIMSKELREESKFWNVTVAVVIGGKTEYLPIFNANFGEAMSLWYQNNYDSFVDLVESKNYNPDCTIEMTDDDYTAEASKYCPDHCHCYGHIHQCCLSCSGGKTVDQYECVWYKTIMDSQIAIAKSIFYQEHREKCLPGANEALEPWVTSNWAWTPWFNSASGGLSQSLTTPFKGIQCSGTYCDKKKLRFGPDDVFLGGGTWTAYFSEENPIMKCPNGQFIKQIQCSDDYCDNQRLLCTGLKSNYRTSSSTKVLGWISSANTNPTYFGKGYYAYGIECSGPWCGSIKIHARLIQTIVDNTPLPDPETKKTIAENPIALKKTKDHPMGKDIAVSKGVF